MISQFVLFQTTCSFQTLSYLKQKSGSIVDSTKNRFRENWKTSRCDFAKIREGGKRMLLWGQNTTCNSSIRSKCYPPYKYSFLSHLSIHCLSLYLFLFWLLAMFGLGTNYHTRMHAQTKFIR